MLKKNDKKTKLLVYWTDSVNCWFENNKYIDKNNQIIKKHYNLFWNLIWLKFKSFLKIINVFTATFNRFNTFLLNKRIKKKKNPNMISYDVVKYDHNGYLYCIKL